MKTEMIKQIIGVIKDYKDPERIVLFGSRAGSGCRSSSDIDIAIYAQDWNSMDFNMVRDRIEENIKTPLKFDIIDYYRVKKNGLKKNIDEGVVIYDRAKDK